MGGKGGGDSPPLIRNNHYAIFLHRKHDYSFSDLKDMYIEQLLVEKIWNVFGGSPPIAPSKGGNQEKLPLVTAYDTHFPF